MEFNPDDYTFEPIDVDNFNPDDYTFESVDKVSSKPEDVSKVNPDEYSFETVETNVKPSDRSKMLQDVERAKVQTKQSGQVLDSIKVPESDTILPTWLTGRKWSEKAIANYVETAIQGGMRRQDILNSLKENGATPLDLQNAAKYHATRDVRDMPSAQDYEIIVEGGKRGLAKPGLAVTKAVGEVYEKATGDTRLSDVADKAIGRVQGESQRDKDKFGMTNPVETLTTYSYDAALMGSPFKSIVGTVLLESGLEGSRTYAETSDYKEALKNAAIVGGTVGGTMAAGKIAGSILEDKGSKALKTISKYAGLDSKETSDLINKVNKGHDVSEDLVDKIRFQAQAGNERSKVFLAEALNRSPEARTNFLKQLDSETRSVLGFDKKIDEIIMANTNKSEQGLLATDWTQVAKEVNDLQAEEVYLSGIKGSTPQPLVDRINVLAKTNKNEKAWQQVALNSGNIDTLTDVGKDFQVGIRTEVLSNFKAALNKTGMQKLLSFLKTDEDKAVDVIVKSLERGKVKPKKLYTELRTTLRKQYIDDGMKPSEAAVKADNDALSVAEDLQKEGGLDINSPEKMEQLKTISDGEWEAYQQQRARTFNAINEAKKEGVGMEPVGDGIVTHYSDLNEQYSMLREAEKKLPPADPARKEIRDRLDAIRKEAVRREYGDSEVVSKHSKDGSTIVKTENGTAHKVEKGNKSKTLIQDSEGNNVAQVDTWAPKSGTIDSKIDQRRLRKENLTNILSEDDRYKFESYRDEIKAQGKRPPYFSDLVKNKSLQEKLGIEIKPEQVKTYYTNNPSRLNNEMPSTLKEMDSNSPLGKIIEENTIVDEIGKVVDWVNVYKQAKSKNILRGGKFEKDLKNYIDTMYGIPKPVREKYGLEDIRVSGFDAQSQIAKQLGGK